MRYIIILFILIPILTFSQEVVADTIGQSGRISYTDIDQNIHIGLGSGNVSSTGAFNTYVGNLSGSNNTTGNRNISLGTNSGFGNTTGISNVHIGAVAGALNQSGRGNVNIGDSAGYSDDLGSYNVRIGQESGTFAYGSGNVFIGYRSGYNSQGDNKLMIGNTDSKPPLISGDFATDSLAINGNLHVTGNITGNLSNQIITTTKITGLLGSGYSFIPPNVADNTVTVEIGSIGTTDVLVTSTIGYELDTFRVSSAGASIETGFNAEFPFIFETADPADITVFNDWFANPTEQDLSIIIKDASGVEVKRFNLDKYFPDSSSPGSGGRTAFKLKHNSAPNPTTNFGLIGSDFGTTSSYNPLTDKVVEIAGITSPDFCPAVTVDYAKKVITLEVDYDEGAGIHDWMEDIAAAGSGAMVTIIETTSGPGSTEISREDFFESRSFRYEIIYGFRLDTKLKARISIFYRDNAPG